MRAAAGTSGCPACHCASAEALRASIARKIITKPSGSVSSGRKERGEGGFFLFATLRQLPFSEDAGGNLKESSSGLTRPSFVLHCEGALFCGGGGEEGGGGRGGKRERAVGPRAVGGGVGGTKCPHARCVGARALGFP